MSADIIAFTDRARAKVREFMDSTDNGCIGVRVAASRQGRRSFRYDLTLVLEGESFPSDLVVDLDLFSVYIDPQSAEWTRGTTVDFVSDLTGAGFTFDNPNAGVVWDDPVAQRVQTVLDERVGPAIASHGGWVDLVRVDGDTAVIEMGGGCQGCGLSQVTVTQGIEAAILEDVPEIAKVVDATDHDAGENPYYAG